VGLIAKFQFSAWWYNSFGVWFGVGKKIECFMRCLIAKNEKCLIFKNHQVRHQVPKSSKYKDA